MKYKRIVVKVGTNLVNKADNSLNADFLKSIVDQIAELHKKGHEVVLVTSGAVASGRKDIKLKKETHNIPYRQVLAAVGQGILINIYHELFAEEGINVAQALLTNHNFVNRKSYITTRNTLNLLMNHKVVPVINENDVTTYDELKFSDNDMLSAKTAAMIDADLLIILTDVPCVYNKDPKKHKDAQCIRVIEEIDTKIKKVAEKSSSKKTLGGMETKIQAAEFAVNSGIPVVICGGDMKDVLHRIVEKGDLIGTLIKTSAEKHENRKVWLKAHVKKGAKIIVDDGAKNAIIKKGSSLLPVGVKGAKGTFNRGDVVQVYDLENNLLGVGQSNYKSTSVDKIKGCHSKDILGTLGKVLEEEVIHRDNMVVF
ncbi:MAG: glutamate 5-kinase [Patescibacteria group bacterium]